jgi:prefoldin subunit 5
MLAILRDRINDLASANADLEKEVARLRYAHSAMAEVEKSKDELEAAKSHLQVAKVTLNDIKNENEQLKLAIGKARLVVSSDFLLVIT